LTKITEQQVAGTLKEKERLRKKRLCYLDWSIILLLAAFCGFIYAYYPDYLVMKSIVICIAIGTGMYYISKLLKHDDSCLHVPEVCAQVNPISDISGIIMLNENGAYLREWNIQGRIAVLIGKNTKNKEVDIDLSDSVYDALIHEEHAIMNYAGGDWYLEGLHMPSHIGIKKADNKMCYRLTGNKPCKLEKGDIVHIANTRLLIK
jgi:hypothetical protein